MKRRKAYYFEVAESDEEEELRGWGIKEFGIGSYLNRTGMTPVKSFRDGDALIVAMAEERRHRRYGGEKVTQQDVADAMGISKSFVARIESESKRDPPRVPTLETLKSYAAALGYDLRIVCIPRTDE